MLLDIVASAVRAWRAAAEKRNRESPAQGHLHPEFIDMARPDLAQQARALLRAIESDEAQSPTLADLWPLYWQTEAQHLPSSRRTKDAWEAIRYVQGSDGLMLEQRHALTVTAEVVEEIRAELGKVITRTGGPLKPATRNRYFIVLRRLLNWSVEQRKIHYNPLLLHLEHEDNVRQTCLRTEEDFQRLLDACDEWNRALCLLYFDCGCRRMEGIDLRRDQVKKNDDGGGTATIYKTKRRRPRTIGITKRTMDALDALPMRSQFYFARPDGKAPYHRRYLYHRFEIAVARSGLQPAPGERFTWHTLRHSFCYQWRIVYGIPESTCMLQSGHTTRATFERYGLNDGREIASAMAIVEAAHRRKEPRHAGAVAKTQEFAAADGRRGPKRAESYTDTPIGKADVKIS